MRPAVAVTGWCAVLGGAAFVAACVAQNTQPQGCIGDSCATRPMRDSPDSAVALAALAAALIAVSAAGLLLVARGRGRLGRAGAVGAVLGGLGLAVLAASGVVGAYDPNFSAMPGLVVPGVLFVVVGLVLLAWTVHRAAVLPTWLTVTLLLCVAVMGGANEQTSRILLAVPFGLAWMLVGVVVMRPAAARVTSGRAP
jgi:hypothetical protein